MEKNNSLTEPLEISKGLENFNYKHLLQLKKSKKELSKITRHKQFRSWFLRKKVYPVKKKKECEPKTQLVAFQQAMKLLLIAGQCLGLNPVMGALSTDVTKMRFSILNWRFLYTIIIGIAQTFAAVLTLYKLFKTPLTVAAIGSFSFYITTCITTFLYLQVGTKWPSLMKEMADTSLNEYIDRKVKLKCYAYCILIFMLALVEHILSLIADLSVISLCSPDIDVYDRYHRQKFKWYYEQELPDGRIIAVIIQILITITTLNWNYSDVYIVCISFYLSSLLDQINKKITLTSKKRFIPLTQWRILREHYCKATRLVRSFDDVISGIVFMAFASNLIFICLQIFNILVHGLNTKHANESKCEQFAIGIISGDEYKIYVGFSALYLLARTLTMSVIAASLHSASLMTASALYNVPSTSYCSEVARFLDQVHGNRVALSGLKFFYVTRELVLSMAGTIVTYELVVLQVSIEDD